MKHIDILKQRNFPTGNVLALGNGKRIHFSSKRKMGYFVAETNRFLTKCLVIVNGVYVEVFKEYREMWFVSSNNHMGTRTNYLSIAAKIKTSLDATEAMLNKFNTAYGSNDPFFSFINLKKASMFLNEAAAMLSAFHKQRNETSGYYSCLVLAERCLVIIDKLQSYDYTN